MKTLTANENSDSKIKFFKVTKKKKKKESKIIFSENYKNSHQKRKTLAKPKILFPIEILAQQNKMYSIDTTKVKTLVSREK